MVTHAGNGHPVPLGSRVRVRHQSGRRSEVRIAPGDQESMPFDIAADSPLAAALLGRRAGDRVGVELAPGAVIALVILRVD